MPSRPLLSPFTSESDAFRSESDQDAEPFQDYFRQVVGRELPSHLNTNTRRWASLLLVSISGAFASGPFASWPTLEPLLIEEGVWAGPNQLVNLSSVYSIAMGVAMMSLLLAGILYDVFGARAIGAGGAFGTSVCLLAMGMAIKIPSLNNLLWVAYPLANVFGYANSMDCYAWLWLLPDDQNTVAAVTGAIQCLSDSFCLVAVFMHDYFGFQLPVYFTMTAGLSVVAGVIALVVIPPREEMRQIEAAVIRHQEITAASGSRGYGATNSAPPQRQVTPFARQVTPFEPKSTTGKDTAGEILSRAASSIYSTCIVYSKVHPGISALFFFYSTGQYMFTVYPMFEMFPLYESLLGSSKAVELVDIYGGIYAVTGAVCLVLFGKIVDKIGLVQAIAWLIVPTVINAVLYAVPTIPAEVAGQVFLAWMANLWYVYIPRFCTAYGPPELFGGMYGVLSGLLGVFQIILTRLGTFVCKAIMLSLYSGDVPGALPYLVTISLWAVWTVLGSALLVCYWWYYPIPGVGTTTMAHVRNASGESDADGETLSLTEGLKKDHSWNVLPKTAEAAREGKTASTSTCCSCLHII